MLQLLQGFGAKYSLPQVFRRNPSECAGCVYKHARLDLRTSAAMKNFHLGQAQGEHSMPLSDS